MAGGGWSWRSPGPRCGASWQDRAGGGTAPRGAGSSSRPGRAGGGWALPGPGRTSRYHEGARYHPRPQLEVQRRVLSGPGLQDEGWDRSPQPSSSGLQRPPRPPPPVPVQRSPARRRRGGRDWTRNEAGRDLEKPPRLHCSGRGRPEEPVPLSRLPAGRSRCPVPRCLALPGLGRCRLAGTRGSKRGSPRPADPSAATTSRTANAGRPTVAEKVVSAAQEVLPRRSSVASGIRINHLCGAFG